MEETTSNGSEVESGKKKALMIGVIVGGILLVAGAIFVMRGSGGDEATMDGVGDSEKGEGRMSSKDAVKMSFQDLLGGGKSQKCTFSDESEMSKSEWRRFPREAVSRVRSFDI